MKVKKRVFYLIVCLLLSCVLPSFSQQSQEGVALDKSWYGGDAREYVISSAAQLMAFSEMVASGNDFAGKTVYLRNDIDVSQHVWSPVGTLLNPFSGTFDGDGYCITIGNIQVGEAGGLFGYLKSAVVRNISVSITGELSGIKTVGAVAAFVDESSVIDFCSHVSSMRVRDIFVLGGIVGESDGKIFSCRNLGNVQNLNSEANVCGGIVGISSGEVLNSANEAIVCGTAVCGGVVGCDKEDGKSFIISRCNNIGKVFARSSGTDLTSDVVAGGIAGILSRTAISECYNDGKVSSYCYNNSGGGMEFHSYSGGLLGMGTGNISTSYNVGDVVSRYFADVSGVLYVYAGGLVGYDNGSFNSAYSYSYNAGYVYAFGQGANIANLNYGGVLGDFSSFMPEMKCCYSVSDFSSADIVDGGNTITYPKNIGVQVTAEQMRVSTFLYSDKDISGLNDNYAYLTDDGILNKGFPVVIGVQTLGMKRTTEDGVVLKGTSKVTGERGFFYWIKGLEEYVAEIGATSDFEYVLDKLERGNDYSFQAYVRTSDGTLIKGEVVSFHVPE